MKGARDIYNKDIECNLIFVKTPTLEDLKIRLIARKTETEESLNKRLKNAEKEIQLAEQLGIYKQTFLNGNDREIFIKETEDYIIKDLYK